MGARGAEAVRGDGAAGVRQPSASAALRAAEAAWRATVQDHGAEETAPRIAAWRRLEALRANEEGK